MIKTLIILNKKTIIQLHNTRAITAHSKNKSSLSPHTGMSWSSEHPIVHKAIFPLKEKRDQASEDMNETYSFFSSNPRNWMPMPFFENQP